MSSGYAGLKRWTRNVDIFQQDVILIPIHLERHWCLATVCPKEKAIRYYDSMGGRNLELLNRLKEFMEAESIDKNKTQLDTRSWKLECVTNIPQQTNGSDCGVFLCKIRRACISSSPVFNFQQRDMPYFRRQMVYEILTKKLLKPLTTPTEIQLKASAPNTIQYLPARPQTTGPSPRNIDMPPGKFTTLFHPIHSKTVNVNNYISGVKIPDENLTPPQKQHVIMPGGPGPMMMVGRPSSMMPQQQQQPPPPQQTMTAAKAAAAANAAEPGPLPVSSGMGKMPMNVGGMIPSGPMKGTNGEPKGPGNMMNDPNPGRPMAGVVPPKPSPMTEIFMQDVLSSIEKDLKQHRELEKKKEEEKKTKEKIFTIKKNKRTLKKKIKDIIQTAFKYTVNAFREEVIELLSAGLTLVDFTFWFETQWERKRLLRET